MTLYTENKEKNTKYFQNKIFEILIRPPHNVILPRLRQEYLNNIIIKVKKIFPLTRAFIKYHLGENEDTHHSHLVIQLIDKPKIKAKELTVYFQKNLLIDHVEKVNLSKCPNQLGLNKKFSKIVKYLTDGHDNGRYKDTANYKYDIELADCRGCVLSKSLLYLRRNIKLQQIYLKLDTRERTFFLQKKSEIIRLYREFVEFQTAYEPPVFNNLQKEIIVQMSNTKEGRGILNIVDVSGGIGKTTIAKHLMFIEPLDTLLIPNGKTSDIAHAYQGQKTIIIDLTRTSAQRINYDIMEQLINACVFSGKYESQLKIYKIKPRLTIFSNSFLEYNKLTFDRWSVFQVVNNKLKKISTHTLEFGGEPLNQTQGELYDY